MFANLTSGLEIHAKALVLRAERQRLIASNIANADTPGYAARDIDFKESLLQSTGQSGELKLSVSRPGFDSANSATHNRHIALTGISASQITNLAYVAQTQPSVDSNSVDMDRERANFVDNSVRYESTLRFINGSAKGILSAIQGQ